MLALQTRRPRRRRISTKRVGAFSLALVLATAAAPRAQSIPIAVSNLADAGPGSFRAAVAEANRQARNASPGRRIEITFASGLAGGVVAVQGEFPMLFADYVTIQVAGSPLTPVVLAMPSSFVAAGDDMWLRDLTFRRPAASAGIGDNVILIGSRRCRFERCVFENAPIAGLFLVGCPDATLSACVFRNFVAGRLGMGFLGLDGSDRLIADGCRFEGLLAHGLTLASVVGCHVRNCTFRGVAGAAQITENCLEIEFGPDNLIENSTAIGITGDLVGPRQPANRASIGLKIARNTFRDGGTTAILISNRSSHVVLEDNLMERNGRDLQAQVVLRDTQVGLVRNNRILNGFGAGLALVGGHDIDVHSGNLIDGNAAEGVIVADGASDIWIGPRDPAGAVLGNTIRNNRGLAARFNAVSRCHLTGNTTQPGGRTVFLDNVGPIVVTEGSTGCDLGPGLDVVGGSSSAMELVGGSTSIRLLDVIASRYRERGLRVVACADVVVRSCRFQGSGAATHGVQFFDSTPVNLFGNSSDNHVVGGFSFNGCAQVLVGPGNRATRNVQFGFVFDRGSAAAARASVQSVVALNHSGTGAGIVFVNASGVVTNATSAGNHQGIQLGGTANVSVFNSIFWANRDRDRVAGTAAVAAMHDSVHLTGQGTWSGQGGITSNPRFANLGADDVRLQAGSPAIDSGNAFAADLAAADLAGAQRAQGLAVDRGAFEAAGGAATRLSLAGLVQRDRSANTFGFDLDAGALRAGQQRLLLLGFSGTAPGYPLFAGARLPLEPDALTIAWIGTPWALGVLDGAGREHLSITLPLPVMAVLPAELTFAFTLLPGLDWASNPVVVRLW